MLHFAYYLLFFCAREHFSIQFRDDCSRGRTNKQAKIGTAFGKFPGDLPDTLTEFCFESMDLTVLKLTSSLDLELST